MEPTLPYHPKDQGNMIGRVGCMAYPSLLDYRYIDRRVSKKFLVFKGWRSVMIVDFIRHRLHTRPNVSKGTLSDKCYKKQAKHDPTHTCTIKEHRPLLHTIDNGTHVGQLLTAVVIYPQSITAHSDTALPVFSWRLLWRPVAECDWPAQVPAVCSFVLSTHISGVGLTKEQANCDVDQQVVHVHSTVRTFVTK